MTRQESDWPILAVKPVKAGAQRWQQVDAFKAEALSAQEAGSGGT